MVNLRKIAMDLMVMSSVLLLIAGCSATQPVEPVAEPSLLLEHMQRPTVETASLQPLTSEIQQALLPPLFAADQHGDNAEMEHRFDVAAEAVEASAFSQALLRAQQPIWLFIPMSQEQ